MAYPCREFADNSELLKDNRDSNHQREAIGGQQGNCSSELRNWCGFVKVHRTIMNVCMVLLCQYNVGVHVIVA
jgi:hypothetical protein